MAENSSYSISQLALGDTERMRGLLSMFGTAFDEADTYTGAQPTDGYLEDLLDSENFVAVVAEQAGSVVGGLAAYQLKKFERERSEFHIYDLAVAETHRRRGIATALIAQLRKVAASRGAYLIFVQADYGDEPAINLYTKLGKREDVLHFDIDVP